MPEQFHFNRTNPTVTAALTPQEINAVTRWQRSPEGFLFEFHTMHEAGWPCYLREAAPTGDSRRSTCWITTGRCCSRTK